MTQTVHVTVTDDIDQTEGADTYSFALDGTAYEIDLGKKNADKLTKALAPFIEHARKSAAPKAARRPGGRSNASRKDSAAIRAWATEHGLNVSNRGRIPAEVVAKYEADQG